MKTSAAGKSDYDIILAKLKAAGFTVDLRIPDANPGIKDRVNAMNAKLKSANGNTQFTFDPIKCPHLKRDFERVVWKEGTGAILDQRRDPTLTHSSDNVGYAVHEFSPIQSQNQVGTLKVILR
jgi:hypothetical protein